MPHGRGRFFSWFRKHSKEWNIRVVPVLRVQVTPSRFRVPDVAVLDRDLGIEQIATHPPVAVFEVFVARRHSREVAAQTLRLPGDGHFADLDSEPKNRRLVEVRRGTAGDGSRIPPRHGQVCDL
jgi:hypothetical protein